MKNNNLHGSFGASAIALLALVLISCGAVSEQEERTAAAERWWSHVEYLASDELEGRLTGSEGFRLSVQKSTD